MRGFLALAACEPPAIARTTRTNKVEAILRGTL